MLAPPSKTWMSPLLRNRMPKPSALMTHEFFDVAPNTTAAQSSEALSSSSSPASTSNSIVNGLPKAKL